MKIDWEDISKQLDSLCEDMELVFLHPEDLNSKSKEWFKEHFPTVYKKHFKDCV